MLERCKQSLIKIKEVFIRRPFYTLCGVPVIWRFINRVSIRKYQSEHRTESPEIVRIISELKKSGIALSHLDTLFPGKSLLPTFTSQADRLRATAHVREKKPFLMELWEAAPTLDLSDSFTQVALSSPVMSVINGYLGLWSRFYYHMLALTTPRGEGAAPRDSQRWHRDPEDTRMCKFFIYLNDVDAATGPFTYVKGSQETGQYRNIYPQQRPTGVYPPIGEVEKHVAPEDILTCIGKAGTVVFADTSGLHKGGYATEKERMMYTAGFVSDATSFPIRYILPADRKGFEDLPEKIRFALELA